MTGRQARERKQDTVLAGVLTALFVAAAVLLAVNELVVLAGSVW